MKKVLSIVLAVMMLVSSLSTGAIHALAGSVSAIAEAIDSGLSVRKIDGGKGGGNAVNGGTDGGSGSGGAAGNGSTMQIEGIHSVIVGGATQQPNGDWVWTPTNTNADHAFKFNVTYSVSGEFDYFESGQVEIHIPKSILMDQSGTLSDYFEMSLPLETEPDLDEDNVFVYKIVGDEIIVYNRLACPAAEHGYFEISYSTSKRTYDYQDYDPAGATPDERNLTGSFQAHLYLNRNNEHYDRAGEVNNVFIDTTAKITKEEKAAPQKQYDGATQWQSNWGTKPADAGQYYYLIWEVRSTITATQRYDFWLVENYEATGAADTELVAVRLQGQSTYVPISDPDCGKLYNQTTSYPSGRYDYILTRHLKATYDPQETYSFLNKVVGHVHPRDGVDDNTEQPAQRRWTFEHPVFVPGSGVGLSFDKYGLDYNDKKVVNSESIRMFGLEPYYLGNSAEISNLAYITSVAATTWNLTVVGDNNDPANYGKKYATVELTDNKIKIKALGKEYGDYLVSGEYYFEKVVLSYTLLDAYFDSNSQSFKTKAVTYTDTDAIDVWAQFGTDSWVKVASLALKTGVWTITSDGTAHRVSASGKTVTFGDNGCTGYRFVTTNKHYKTTLTAKPFVTLLRSAVVTAVVNEAYDNQNNEIAIQNTAGCAVYAADDNTGSPYRTASKSGVDYATGIIRHSEINKTVRYVNQPVDQNVRLTWSVNMNESYNTATGSRAYVAQQSGTFYDLLPIGATFDRDSLAVFADKTKLNSNEYSYSLVQDYANSGRWLLTIQIHEPAKSTYSFSYATNHSWDSISEFGNDVLNSVVYETGNIDIGDGRPDDGGPVGTSNPDHQYLVNLDPDTDAKKFIYTKTESTLTILTAGNLGLYKQVAAAGDARYSYKTTTVSSGDYSYKIHFATDAATWARDMILIDSLENFETIEEKTSDWHGTLQSFDISVLNGYGIKADIYYSTVPGLVVYGSESEGGLGIDENYNFSAHSTIWTKATGPSDPNLKNATAFAIDMRKTTGGADFILQPNKALSVTVFMKAPAAITSESTDPIAYNNINLFNSVKFGKDSDFSEGTLNHQDYTQISFRQKADIEILKVDAEIYETTGELVPIPGIVFRLWGTSHYDDDIDVTLTTNSQGKIKFSNIPRGTYYLQEVDGIDDYLQNHMLMTVTIDQNGVVHIGEPVGESQYDWTVYDGLVIGVDEDTGIWMLGNPPRIHGDLDFDKRGSIDGQSGALTPLPNVSFAITGTSGYGTVINMIVTSAADGVVHIVNLEMGTYEMVEISTDDEHILLDRVYTVKCDAAGEITIYYMDGDEIVYPLENGMFTIVNEPYHKFKLWKYNNALPSNSVAGAKFSLSGDGYYREVVSDDAGLIEFTGLEAGTYILKELVAPEGYELDETNHVVVVSSDGSVTIDGLTRDEFIQNFLQKYSNTTTDTHDWDYFPIGNEPVKKTITIIKQWVGGTPDENTTPVLHLDTTKPDFNAPEATIDYSAWRMYVNGATVSESSDVPTNTNGLIQQKLNLSMNDAKWRVDVISFEKYSNRAVPSEAEMNQTITESWSDIASYVTTTSQAIFTAETRSLLEKWRRIDDGTTKYRIFIKLEHIADVPGDVNVAQYKAVWWSDAPNVYFPKNASRMFSGLTNMTGTLDVRGIKFSRTTDMSHLFESSSCSSIRLETDTGSALTMEAMFRACKTAQLQDISGLDTSHVTNMRRMFQRSRIVSADFSGWDVSSVTTMEEMFNGAYLSTVTLNNWNVCSVETFKRMFYACYDNPNATYGLVSVNAKNWNITNEASLEDMFQNCRLLQSVDISGWKLGSAEKTLSGMFAYCYKLDNLNISGWTGTGSITDTSGMFQNCQLIETVDISYWDLSNVTNMSSMFYGCYNVVIDPSSWNVESLEYARSTFSYCYALTTVDLSAWNCASAISFSSMFNGSKNLTSVIMPAGANALAHIQSLSWMFANCTGLTSFELSGRNLSGLSNYVDMPSGSTETAGLERMFTGCSKLVTVDLSNTYVPNTTNVDGMFSGCKEMTTCNLAGFIVGGGPGCEYGLAADSMFAECNKLQTIDISGFMTPTPEMKANVAHMFKNCYALETIWASAEWPDDAFVGATNGGGTLSCYLMFSGCTLLHNDGYANSINYCTFTTNTTLPGNFTQKAAPTVPTFPADPVPNNQNSIPGSNLQLNALPGSAHIMADGDGAGSGTESGSTGTATNPNVISQTSEADKWVDNGDGTWSYTFDIYDVDATYYLWEGAMAGWETDAGIANPITIVYKAGGTIQSATSANDPYPRLVGPDENGVYAVKITNTKTTPQTTSLTVKKVVTNDGDKDASFTIHIKLTGAVLNGTYGDVTLTDGEADVQLKGGQQVALTDLPVGVSYVITEPDPQGHTKTIENATGTLSTAGASATVTVTNDKVNPPTSELKIEKELKAGTGATLTNEDRARTFSVTVTLYTDSALTQVATNVTGLFGDVYFENGVSTTLMIKGGETVSITGLPTVASSTGTTTTYTDLYYKVEEAVVEEFEVSYTNQSGQTTRTSATGTTTTVTAKITNTKINPPKGGFRITKVIDGDSNDTTTEFTFNVVFADLTPGATYTYTVAGTSKTFTALSSGAGFVELTLKNGQTAIFTELPEGAKYTVTEASSGFIASYTVVSNKTVAGASGNNTVPYIALATAQETVEDGEDATVTFTNAPALVNKSGFKTWVDDNNSDQLRPTSITIYLMEGTAQIDSVVVTAADNWEWSFDNLPKYDNSGNEIEYTFEEEIIYGYDTTYNGNEIINTHIPDRVEITVEKEWVDNNNSANTRPGTIVINLFADDVLKETVSVIADPETGYWTYTFTNLPKYKYVAGEQPQTIVYRVTENAVPGYASTVEQKSPVTTGKITKITYTITNKAIVNIEGEKIWEDANDVENIRPTSITVHLYADDVDTGKTYVASADTNWHYSFSNLDKFNANGDEILYDVKEDTVSGYITVYDGYDIINRLETESSVEKVWDDMTDADGIRPESIKVQMYADGEAYGEQVSLNEDNDWSYTVTGLEKYKEVSNGKFELIKYTWKEVATPQYYTLESTVTVGTLTTITNKHTPEYVDATVKKVWNDANDQDKQRPATLVVELLADNDSLVPVVTKTLTAASNWAQQTVQNLPKYKFTVSSDGTVTRTTISYSWTEVDLPDGYELTDSSVNGIITTLTNTHTTDKTSVEVEKVWADNNDQDKIRPTSITVQLKAGSENYGDPVVLNEGNNWKYTWSNLEKNANGVAIVYSVDEVSVPDGYTKTVEANNTKTKYTITNTHTPDKISINVEKQWRDDDNRDGLRPQSIHVQLKADGKAVGDPVELSETNNWKHTWTNLDKNANGKEIEYTVEETDLPAGYGITVNGTPKEGFLIINPHEPVKIDLEGVKIWEGETDKDHQRPSSVTIRLYADGIEIDFAVVTAASGWTFKFTGLYKFNGGNEIKYTITEDPVVGYKTSINGTTVTNTWEPPETPPTGDREIIATVAMLFTSALGIAFALERKRRRKIDSV